MKQRYQTPLPPTWFLGRPGFVKFMVREATALFVWFYVLLLIVWLHRLGQGPEAWASLMATARHPLFIALHVIVLLGVVYHAVTWFNLTPKIMPMYLGEDRLPDALAAVLMGYGPWAAVSALILWGVLR